MDNYTGKILFISEENDINWPSKEMTDMLIEHSKNKNNIQHITMNLEDHYLMNYALKNIKFTPSLDI